MKLVQKYQSPSGPLSWEQQYINMTPPVKYNPVEANRPGFPKTQQFKTSRLSNFKNIFNKNVKSIFGGLTSFNAAPYAMLGVMTTPDTLPDDYHIEFKNGKPTVVEHNLGIIKNSANKFQWNNKYWAKIGNKYRGLGYNEYMQEFNKWFDQQNFNPLEKDNRNYIAKQNWNRYVKLGYNKPINTLNEVVVTPEKNPKADYLSDNTQALAYTPPASAESDLSENSPLVQEFLKKNGYVKSTSTDASKNGNTAENAKSEHEIIKPEEQKQVTYSDILLQNTNLVKNRIFNSGWRGAFKDRLDEALQTPDYYNNGEGTQVFDFELPDGTIINYDYLSGNGLLNKHGLLKAGAMRKLAKNFKQQGRNIAQQRYVGIGNQQISPNATPPIVNASIVNGGQPIVPVVNGQVATEINSFGLDKAIGYPSMVNNFNGTSYIDSNAAYRAEQEKQNAINLQNRS